MKREEDPTGVEILLFLFAAVFLWDLWLGVHLDLSARRILIAEFDGLPLRAVERWLAGSGAIYAEADLAGFDVRTLLTAPFVHFGILHIVFNGYVLKDVGREVEGLDGRAVLLLAFLSTALVASIASVAWHVVLWGSPLMQAGASGGICGIIGVLYRRAGRYLAGGAIRKQIVRWMTMIVIFSLAVRGDNAAHLGGFAAGVFLEPLFFRLRVRKNERLAWSLVAALSVIPVSYAVMVVRAV